MKFRGLVVRTSAFQPEIWGSIPPQAVLLFFKGFTRFSKIILIKGNFPILPTAKYPILPNTIIDHSE